jgi:adenylate cyclase
MNQLTIAECIAESNRLLEESRSFYAQSDLEKSESSVQDVLTLLMPYSKRKDLGEHTDQSSPIYTVIANIAHAYNRLNTIYDSKGNFHKAIEYANTAIAYCEMINLQWRIANLYGNIGGCYASIGDFPRSLEFLNRALTYAEENGDEKLTSTWLGNIAAVYGYMGDLQRALEIQTRFQSIAKKIADVELIASADLSIGQTYFALKEYDLAFEYLFRSLDSFKAQNKKQDIAIVLTNIGIIYDNKGEYESALTLLKEALAINEEISSMSYAANCMGNIGDVYIRIGEYHHAIEYLKKALSQAEEIDDRRQQAHWIYGLGTAYSYLENTYWVDSERYLKVAVNLANELGLIELEARCRKTMSDLYRKELRWEESANEFRMFYELEHRVLTEEATKQAQQIENRRKIDEAERDRQLKIAKHEITTLLLHKTLPPSIAERILNGESPIVDSFKSVSILFADIVGFTPLASRLAPSIVVELLNNLFTRFDKLTEVFRIERIKTIGDAYMAVAGAPDVCEDHAERILDFALAMLEETTVFRAEVNKDIHLRIGINSGEAIGAIVGETKFSYDLWGDAVNTASRMESHGEAGRIHVSDDFRIAVETYRGTSLINNDTSPINNGASLRPNIQFIPLGQIEIKGKGRMKTYFLERVE